MPENKGDDEKQEGYFVKYQAVNQTSENSNDSIDFISLDDFVEINEDNVLVYERETNSGRKEKGFINLNKVVYYKKFTD